MILTLAAMVLQFPAVLPTLNLRTFSGATENTATVAEKSPKATTNFPETTANASSAPKAPAVGDLILNSSLPARDSRAAALSLSPIYGSQDHPGRRRREWVALSLAQHGAATFDAWSTRQAVSTGRFEEANPLLRPFAGNSSLYATIQIAPLLFDYLGRRMMTSEHGWLRHSWWIPQALSTGISLGSGAHNLSAH
jgi:hypothetical protein